MDWNAMASALATISEPDGFVKAPSLGFEVGDDAMKWAPVALAAVIARRATRESPRPEPEALANAPMELRVVAAAAAHHEATIQLGGYSLRALDQWTILPVGELAGHRYEGLAEWGGDAGAALRRRSSHVMMLAEGHLEVAVGWTPGEDKIQLAIYSEPLAGIPDHERYSESDYSIGGWLFTMLSHDVWQLELSEHGTMHPTLAKRGLHNALEDVWALLNQAALENLIL